MVIRPFLKIVSLLRMHVFFLWSMKRFILHILYYCMYFIHRKGPHCLNRGGTRSQCGLLEGIDWNQDPWIRNYDAPLSLSGDRMPPVIQEIYTEGDVIEVEVMVTTHHKGHFVFSACPLVPLSDDPSHAREEWSPLRIPSAECFAAHPLKFVSDELYGAKPDPNHPERAYIAPAQIPTWGPGEGPNGQDGVVGALYKMQLELPKGLNGEVVLIQWYYLTANRYGFFEHCHLSF